MTTFLIICGIAFLITLLFCITMIIIVYRTSDFVKMKRILNSTDLLTTSLDDVFLKLVDNCIYITYDEVELWYNKIKIKQKSKAHIEIYQFRK